MFFSFSKWIIITDRVTASSESDCRNIVDFASAAGFDIVVVYSASRVALNISFAFAGPFISLRFRRRRRRSGWNRRFGRWNAHIAHTFTDYLPDCFQERVTEFGGATFGKNPKMIKTHQLIVKKRYITTSFHTTHLFER